MSAITLQFSSGKKLLWKKPLQHANTEIEEIFFNQQNPLSITSLNALIEHLEQGYICLPTSKIHLANQIIPEKFNSLKASNNLVAVIATSGSSGKPKLVPVSLRQIESSVQNAPKTLLPAKNKSWLLSLPLIHMGGLAVLLRSKLNGNNVVVAEGLKTEHIAKALSEFPDIETLSVVPTQLSELIDMGADMVSRLEACKAILIGGGPVGQNLRSSITERNLPVIFSYGLSESFGQIFSLNVLEMDKQSQSQVNNVGFINKANDFKINEESELLLRGPQLFEGYLSDHESNIGLDRWFNTGDLAQLSSDQSVQILMRRTDLIVSGGKNLSPIRIENEIAKHFNFPVQQIAAVGVHNEKWGEIIGLCIEQRVLNYLNMTTNDFEVACNKLSKEIRPRAFQWVEDLPKTDIGKIKRSQIKENWPR